MRTFAAAAIAATTASADAMAAPEFIAGFIYGMTGDDHLTEIEACYAGGDTLISDTQTALNFCEGGDYYYKSGDYHMCLLDAGYAWYDLDVAMASCTGMSDDIDSIKAWA